MTTPPHLKAVTDTVLEVLLPGGRNRVHRYVMSDGTTVTGTLATVNSRDGWPQFLLLDSPSSDGDRRTIAVRHIVTVHPS